MFNKDSDIFVNVKEKVSKCRPIFVERHDISAKLYRNKNAEEPSFSFEARGDHRFDLYKIFTYALFLFLWFNSMMIYFAVKKAKRRRKKELKRKAKEKRAK